MVNSIGVLKEMLIKLILVGFLVVLAIFLRVIYKKKKKNANNNIIATITHDLKTPAIAQIRALELLLKGNFGEVNDSQKYFIKDILSSCNNMLNMLINLLWLYKFDNKKIAINSISFCVNELIEEIFRENKLLLSSKNHHFEFNYSAKMIYIIADKEVFPEFLQSPFCVENILPAVEDILPGGRKSAETAAGMKEVAGLLGSGSGVSAIARAAKECYEVVEEKNNEK